MRHSIRCLLFISLLLLLLLLFLYARLDGKYAHNGQCKKHGASAAARNAHYWNKRKNKRESRQLIIYTYTHFLIMLLISFLQWLSLSWCRCCCLWCCLGKFSPHFHFHFSSSFYLAFSKGCWIFRVVGFNDGIRHWLQQCRYQFTCGIAN